MWGTSSVLKLQTFFLIKICFLYFRIRYIVLTTSLSSNALNSQMYLVVIWYLYKIFFCVCVSGGGGGGGGGGEELKAKKLKACTLLYHLLTSSADLHFSLTVLLFIEGLYFLLSLQCIYIIFKFTMCATEEIPTLYILSGRVLFWKKMLYQRSKFHPLTLVMLNELRCHTQF